MPREGAAAGRGDVGAELLADGGLADARLPHHHHQPALAGAGGVEGALERGELPFPPHERAAVERAQGGGYILRGVRLRALGLGTRGPALCSAPRGRDVGLGVRVVGVEGEDGGAAIAHALPVVERDGGLCFVEQALDVPLHAFAGHRGG